MYACKYFDMCFKIQSKKQGYQPMYKYVRGCDVHINIFRRRYAWPGLSTNYKRVHACN